MPQKKPQLVWIGAGSANKPTIKFDNFDRVTLIDANETACRSLEERAHSDNVRVLNALISGETEEAEFIKYNLEEFSSTKPCRGLKALYPGLSETSREVRPAIGISALMEEQGLSGKNNTLVIDTPDIAVTLIEAIARANYLANFSTIYVQAATEPQYEGMADSAALTSSLEIKYYDLKAEDKSDPDFPIFTFQVNKANIKIQELTTQLKHSEQNNHQLSQEVEALKEKASEDGAENEKVKSRLADVEGWFQARKKQAETLKKELASAKDKIEALKRSQITQQTVSQFTETISASFEKQSTQLTQTANALGQHVTRMHYEQQKGMQNYLRLQQFLTSRELPWVADDWAMQPDALNHIVQLINKEHYDAIIEFGSGYSTLVIATALRFLHTESQDIEQTNQVSSENSSKNMTQDTAVDRLARFVSFEQSKHYYDSTLLHLQENDLAELVDLELSPLVQIDEPDTDSKLFYDCGAKLKQTAESMPSKSSKLLIVVDGPASPNNELIRFAALSELLNRFPAHSLHVVLDDSNRSSEKQVLEKWQSLCEERGLSIRTTQLDTVKGATLLAITP